MSVLNQLVAVVKTKDSSYLARNKKDIEKALDKGFVVSELKSGDYYSCDSCQGLVEYPHKCHGV